jgi:propanol-preferring alcohol dehydrogenase
LDGIHFSDLQGLEYQKDLFQERHLLIVTANTRADGLEFLALAERIPLNPTTVAYPWTEAGQALLDLSRDRFTGAAVLLRA